ncbi:hypothetical protein [Pedobacter sp. NJ-S-72]
MKKLKDWRSWKKKSKVVTVVDLKYWYMAAAAVFVVFTSILLYQTNQFRSTNTNYAATEIVHGGNKATLTLSNGSKISLTESKNGQIANQSGTIIIKKKKIVSLSMKTQNYL